jgi:hypothetical protein
VRVFDLSGSTKSRHLRESGAGGNGMTSSNLGEASGQDPLRKHLYRQLRVRNWGQKKGKKSVDSREEKSLTVSP